MSIVETVGLGIEGQEVTNQILGRASMLRWLILDMKLIFTFHAGLSRFWFSLFVRQVYFADRSLPSRLPREPDLDHLVVLWWLW